MVRFPDLHQRAHGAALGGGVVVGLWSVVRGSVVWVAGRGHSVGIG